MTCFPNSTETMAERAWRYDLRAFSPEPLPGWLFDAYLYPDRSAILFCRDGRPICVLCDLEFLPC